MLTKQDEETLKKHLLDFVFRVSSSNSPKWPEEVNALPAIVQLLRDWPYRS